MFGLIHQSLDGLLCCWKYIYFKGMVQIRLMQRMRMGIDCMGVGKIIKHIKKQVECCHKEICFCFGLLGRMVIFPFEETYEEADFKSAVIFTVLLL